LGNILISLFSLHGVVQEGALYGPNLAIDVLDPRFPKEKSKSYLSPECHDRAYSLGDRSHHAKRIKEGVSRF
jgi:hypothetical protein